MVAAHEETSWMTELKEYILKGTLPADDAEAERIARQAKLYCFYGDELHRKRPNGVALPCISKGEGGSVTEWHPCRRMWSSFLVKHAGGQGIPSRFLLADDASGRHRPREDLRSMSVPRKPD